MNKSRPTGFTVDEILSPDFGNGSSHQPHQDCRKVRSNNCRRCHFPSSASSASSASSSSSGSSSPHFDTSMTETPTRMQSNSASLPASTEGIQTNNSPTTSFSSASWKEKLDLLHFPAWVFCTRYSDRPSSGPRVRKTKRSWTSNGSGEGKRPRTSFTVMQLRRLKQEFEKSNYLSEERRKNLATELNLSEPQVKIWFQNKRAKAKKNVTTTVGKSSSLAAHLMAEGLYNHSVEVKVD